MKTLLKILVITFILFGLEGCYTILWTPDKKMTDDYNSTSYYYGYVTDFYDIPWWITVPIIVDYPYNPTSGNVSITKDRDNSRDGDTKDIRNNDGGRNTGGRIPEILNTPPPTISTGDSNNTSTSSNSNSGSSGSVSRTESSSSSSSGSSNTRSSDTRNDSGSRNSGNERK